MQLSYFTLLNIKCPGSAGVRYLCSQLNFKITDIYFDYFYASLGLPPRATWIFLFFFFVERFTENCKTFLNEGQMETLYLK